jgi:hypothetical protein
VTAPVSLLPSLTGSVLPPANPLGLSDDEQRLVAGLSNKMAVQAVYARQRYLYYDGDQIVQNLGISVPAVLAGVRQVVDWPRVAVDRLVERASEIDGFRLPDSTEVDSELQEHWKANDLDSEFPLVQQDSLVGGSGYMIVGSPDQDGDSPIVTVESPLNLALVWDPRRRMVTAAYQSYEVEGMYRAALYLPDVTISMSRDQSSEWVVDDRDEHRFGEVPVVRFPNRSRSSDRDGRSQITRAIMTQTDSACRSLLGMEIAREVYSIPRLAILGAAESDFVDASGNRKSAIDMAMTKVLALERDEDGQLPTIQQLTAFDPSVFTKIIDEGAQLMSSFTGFPAAYFGQTSTANPASADAIRVAENGVDRAGKRVQQQASAPLRKVGQLTWRFANGGAEVPAEMRRLAVDWVDAATPTPAATSDAISKQIASGAIPATSDVTLGALGWDALQRTRLAQDRNLDVAAQLEAEVTSSMAARQARAGNAIANDLEAAAAPTVGPEKPPQLPPQSR